jgi:hypothetical protein
MTECEKQLQSAIEVIEFYSKDSNFEFDELHGRVFEHLNCFMGVRARQWLEENKEQQCK